jgi:hypothetical protein
MLGIRIGHQTRGGSDSRLGVPPHLDCASLRPLARRSTLGSDAKFRRCHLTERSPPGPSIDSRFGDGLDGHRQIGSNPAEGDVGSSDTPRAQLQPPPTPEPDEALAPASEGEHSRSRQTTAPSPFRWHAATGPGRQTNRHGASAGTIEIVAKQESQVVEKQQPDVCAVSLHGPACASSRRCSRPAGRGETPQCVAKREPASSFSGEQNNRPLSAGTSRQAGL